MACICVALYERADMQQNATMQRMFCTVSLQKFGKEFISLWTTVYGAVCMTWLRKHPQTRLCKFTITRRNTNIISVQNDRARRVKQSILTGVFLYLWSASLQHGRSRAQKSHFH